MTLEHIIPESLGGRLTCEFLCKPCNDYLGHTVDYTARSDPSIRIAAENLRDEIPNLHARLSDRQPIIGTDANGKTKGVLQEGAYKVKSHRAQDGSLIVPTADGRKQLANLLTKAGSSSEDIEQALTKFDEAPDDHKVDVGAGYEVVRWNIRKIELDLSNSKPLSPTLPAKIAYEFMAVIAGNNIYDDNLGLENIRRALQRNEMADEVIKVERLTSERYRANHGIYFSGNKPHATFLVMFLNWLVFRVHFPQVRIDGPKVIYTQHLNPDGERLSILPDEVEKT